MFELMSFPGPEAMADRLAKGAPGMLPARVALCEMMRLADARHGQLVREYRIATDEVHWHFWVDGREVSEVIPNGEWTLSLDEFSEKWLKPLRDRLPRGVERPPYQPDKFGLLSCEVRR